MTKITQISDIPNVNLATPQLQDSLVTGTCICIDIRQHYSCIVCSRKLEESIFTDDTVTCPNCQISTLVSLLETKLVCQLVIKVGEKMATYTAFSDAVQSFLTNMKCYSNTALSDVDIKVLKQQLLHVGPQKMIVDKASKIISQFFPA